MSAFDVNPPADAVISVVPTARELISPLLETVAATVLLEAHEKVMPCRTLPDASRATACACIVERRPIVDDGAVTVMLAMAGAVTVTVSAFDVTDPTVAVMLAVPGATPVTRPLPSTVATDVLLDLQVKLWPESTLPFASLATACACSVPDGATVEPLAVTVTLATEGLEATTVI